jgi:hypothetical protein
MRLRNLMLLVLAVSACEQTDRGRDAGATGQAAPAELHVVKPFADLDSASGAAIARAMADDRGVVFGAQATWRNGVPPNLVVRAQPDPAAPVVARLEFHGQGAGGWIDTLRAAQPDLFGQLTRASHEEYGLASDSVRNGWARVVYGYARDGAEHRGWVELQPDSLQLASYDSLMLTYPSWFTEPAAVTFHRQPNGAVAAFSLEPSYSVHPQSVIGPWIRVHVVVPDTTTCSGDPAAPVQRSATLWVRRVNDNGQRQLWSAVAGC